MRPLTATELLDAWERGQAESHVQQALVLLEMACPEMSPEVLAQISIGERDACLLTLREWAFGPRLTGRTACPNCGDQLEVSFDVADIRVGPGSEAAEDYWLETSDFRVRFRLPISLDLLAVAGSNDMDHAQKQLIERCLLSVEYHGAALACLEAPAEIVDAVAQRLAQADPQADVRIALACPACGHTWETPFDIVSYFWGEVNAWAVRLLRDVHVLARAYGWSEAEILGLSPLRRQAYLGMILG